jgi:hypothetical protein
MCDLATAGLVLSIGSGAYGAVQQNNIAKQNAAFASYEAAQTREIGKANEAAARSKMDRLIAKQRARGEEILPAGYSRGILRVWLREVA